MSYKTNKKDFAEFKKEAEYWIEYFGLKNYSFKFFHDYAEDARAYYWVDLSGKIASVQLSTEWNFKPQKNELKKSAFHEICEIMLSVLSVPARNMYEQDFIQSRTHDIIRRLENTIFKEKRG